MPGRTILAVCEDPAMRIFLRQALESAGHDVLAFGDADGTSDVARDWRPDLIIFDVHHCGGATTWERAVTAACWRLRTNIETRGLPVLLLGADLGQRPAAPLLPARGRLAKPFSLADLDGAVEAVVAPAMRRGRRRGHRPEDGPG